MHGGTISYAFYLFHQPLIHALQASFGGGMGAWAAGVAMTLFIVLGVASGAHHVIEAPAQRWLRQRLSTPRADTIGSRPGKA